MTVHDSSDSNFKIHSPLLRLASHYPVSPLNTPYRVKNVYCGDSEYWQAYAQNEKGSLGLTDYHIAFGLKMQEALIFKGSAKKKAGKKDGGSPSGAGSESGGPELDSSHSA